MNKKQDYILWLPSWYPNKIAPFEGDFIKRHAQAAALYNPIVVVYAIRDEKGLVTKDVYHQINDYGNLREHLIYYYVGSGRFRSLRRIVSYEKYKTLYKSTIKKLFKEMGVPKLVHVHISLKAGVIALWINKKFSIPYFFSEQWTIYLREARPNLDKLPFYFRRIIKKVISNAKDTSVVSNYLGKRLKDIFAIKGYRLIPNVVDRDIFKPIEKHDKSTLQLIHISGLNYQKNVEHIIDALAILKKDLPDFIMKIVGPAQHKLEKQVVNLQLESNVCFLAEMPHQELVKQIQQSDALVLFSRYETFGCVIIEAHACGLPVIVSDIPVHHENVKEGINGLFALNENPESLAELLLLMAQKKYAFNSDNISQYAHENYSFERIGKMFKDWYQCL